MILFPTKMGYDKNPGEGNNMDEEITPKGGIRPTGGLTTTKE
jgi:hypothetical protein